MSADHLYFHWWLDNENHPWVEHNCDDDLDRWRLPPPWTINSDGGISPSLQCDKCGRHVILLDCDRIGQP